MESTAVLMQHETVLMRVSGLSIMNGSAKQYADRMWASASIAPEHASKRRLCSM